MRSYAPRGQSRRFRDGDCPPQVLAIYDTGTARDATPDRYTIFYRKVVAGGPRGAHLGYRGTSAEPFHPLGISYYAEMTLREAQDFRDRHQRHQARWTDLPEAVRRAVREDCTPEPEAP